MKQNDSSTSLNTEQYYETVNAYLLMLFTEIYQGFPVFKCTAKCTEGFFLHNQHLQVVVSFKKFYIFLVLT